MARQNVRDRNIRAASIRLIEAEIRNYHQTVADLREMEEAMALPGQVGEPGVCVQAGTHSDPTAARAASMLTSASLREIRRRVDAIDYMLRALEASPEPGRLAMVRLRYWDNRYTDIGICDQLSIAPRTYYRWRREVLALVAERLGWEI